DRQLLAVLGKLPFFRQKRHIELQLVVVSPQTVEGILEDISIILILVECRIEDPLRRAEHRQRHRAAGNRLAFRLPALALVRLLTAGSQEEGQGKNENHAEKK